MDEDESCRERTGAEGEVNDTIMTLRERYRRWFKRGQVYGVQTRMQFVCTGWPISFFDYINKKAENIIAIWRIKK